MEDDRMLALSSQSGDSQMDEDLGSPQQNRKDPRRVQDRVDYISQPKMMGGEGCVLHPHQFDSLKWMAALIKNNMNGLLADDMGLGKPI